jgi:hypothetical protein
VVIRKLEGVERKKLFQEIQKFYEVSGELARYPLGK